MKKILNFLTLGFYSDYQKYKDYCKKIEEIEDENTESPIRTKKQSYPPTILVDFDGVIHKYSKGWLDGSVYDEPVEGSIQAMAKLQRKGFRVVIFTARREYLEIGKWVQKHDKKKELNFNELIITSTKVPAMRNNFV